MIYFIIKYFIHFNCLYYILEFNISFKELISIIFFISLNFITNYYKDYEILINLLFNKYILMDYQ